MTSNPSHRAERVAWFIAGGLASVLVALLLPTAAARQETQSQAQPVLSAGGATADSNGRMIAVTGLDLTGQSVLYLVDTEAMQLACYQATGGSGSTQGVRLVGARRIDLDLMLDGFNDKTEDSGKPMGYRTLEKRFMDAGVLPANR